MYTAKNINMQNEILVYKGIIHAVNIHRQAITLVSKYSVINI